MRAWICLVLGVAIGCGVEPLPTDECGNRVVDGVREDCDSGPRPEHAAQAVTCAAPDEPNACRYVCDRTAMTPGCPEGWGCGSDGICRHASGTYTDGVSGSAAVSGKLDLADVDGDGRRDLVAVTLDQVTPLFSNGDGTFTAGRIVPAVAPSPAPHVGDLNDDGLADVLTGTFTGFVQSRGQKARSLFPYAQPTFPIASSGVTRTLPIRIGSQQDTDQPTMHLFVLDDESGTLQVRVLDQSSNVDGLLDEIVPVDLGAGSLSDVVGVPASADLDGDNGDEVVLALVGSTSVRVFSPVHNGRSVSDLDVTTVALPAAADSRGLRLVDVDDDDDLDLVVGVETGRVAVALGTGAGTFGAATFDAFFESFDGDPLPFAKVRLGAQRAWVNDFGIYRDDAGTATLIDFNNTFFWRDAVVGDFNHDGLDDMAANVSGKPTLDVFLQTTGGLFAHTRVVTDLLPSNLRVGDFDGDGTADLAFLESASQFLGLGPYKVFVSFGSSQGLTTPISVGVWATVASLEPASVFLPAAVFRDGIDDLVVHGALEPDEPDSLTESYTFLFGSYQRVMFAPYEIKDSTEALRPDHVLVGDYDGDGMVDVATLGSNSDVDGIRIDVARGTGGGNLTTPTFPLASASLNGIIVSSNALTFCSRFRTTHFGDDRRTDVVGLVSGFCTADPTPQLVVVRVDENQAQVEQHALPVGMFSSDEFVTPDFSIGDADGDGLPDVLVSGFDDTFTATAAVLFREADHSFKIVPIDSTDPGGLFGGPSGVALLNADDDPARELVVVGGAGIEVFEIDGRTLTRKSTVIDGFFSGSVFAFDVNGDGLDDLVVHERLGGGEILVFFAVPHDRTDAAPVARP